MNGCFSKVAQFVDQTDRDLDFQGLEKRKKKILKYKGDIKKPEQSHKETEKQTEKKAEREIYTALEKFEIVEVSRPD